MEHNWLLLDAFFLFLRNAIFTTDFENGNGSRKNFWEELPCGIYGLSIGVSESEGCFVGEVKKHAWTNEILKELIKWERNFVEPKPEDLCLSDGQAQGGQHNMLSTCLDAMPSESGNLLLFP